MRARASVHFSALPVVLAAFAAGVVLLQWQPELHSATPCLLTAFLAGATAVAARLFVTHAHAAHVLSHHHKLSAIAAAMAMVAAATLGFGYATWRAQLRLDDALPPGWEGIDIALVGVIDDLPRRLALEVRDESDAAGVVFEIRGVQPEGLRPFTMEGLWF